MEEIVGTIRAVAEGGHALPRRLTGSLFDEIARLALRDRGRDDPRAMKLTNRERQVLALIGEGLSNKEIAARLHIAVPTVSSHVHSLLEKLGRHTRLEIGVDARADAERQAHAPGNRGRGRV